jgi:glycosyltransferase involved in cell wall biosynthesis
MVDIVMVTYNHEKYIEEAIKSVLNQNVGFEYRLIIGDDASTDKTLSICKVYSKEYPQKIIVLESEYNMGIIKNYKRCFDFCTAEYICILEGDDYWISPLKLEKQLLLINSDSNIGLVHSNYIILNDAKQKYYYNPQRLIKFFLNNQGYIYDKLVGNNFISPLTVMFRRKFLSIIDYDFLISENLLTIDYFLFLIISLQAKIAYDNEIFGVYRIVQNSITNDRSFNKRVKFIETKKKILNYFIHDNPVKDFSIKKLKKMTNMQLLYTSILNRDFLHFCIYLKKFSFIGLFNLIRRQYYI